MNSSDYFNHDPKAKNLEDKNSSSKASSALALARQIKKEEFRRARELEREINRLKAEKEAELKEKQKAYYERQRREILEKEARSIEANVIHKQQIAEVKKILAKKYEDFYLERRNGDFVLYDEFPGAYSLLSYCELESHEHPLYQYAYFDVEELSYLIKRLYETRRVGEYEIITVGNTKDRKTLLLNELKEVNPELFIFIGEEKELRDFKKYKNKFINKNLGITNYEPMKDLSIIPLDSEPGYMKRLNLITEFKNKERYVLKPELHYYNRLVNTYITKSFSSQINIFNLVQAIGNEDPLRYGNLSSILAIKVDGTDDFIAKALVSIVMYKYDNRTHDLEKKDYDKITKTLFDKKENIKDKAPKTYVKKLRYVPNPNYRK